MRSSVVVVINSLHSGGAEKTCIDLARALRGEVDLHVVSLVIGGPAERELRALGVRVTVMRADTPAQMLRSFARLAGIIRDEQPAMVITFLYLADLVGGLLGRVLAPRARIVWNVRNNVLARHQTGTASFVAARMNALLSRWIPDTVAYCSPTAQAQHEQLGFRARESVVFENSADAVPFSFDRGKREAFRRGRFADDFVFLLAGRFDPLKRVDLYVDACSQVARETRARVRFALAGRGMDSDNALLTDRIRRSGAAERFDLLGFVDDQQALFSAADCLVVTSDSEGSPNTVFEASATRLPVLILGTIGTEHLTGDGIRRLDSRSADVLADAMREALEQGARSDDDRESGRVDRSPVERPIVAFFRERLARS